MEGCVQADDISALDNGVTDGNAFKRLVGEEAFRLVGNRFAVDADFIAFRTLDEESKRSSGGEGFTDGEFIRQNGVHIALIGQEFVLDGENVFMIGDFFAVRFIAAVIQSQQVFGDFRNAVFRLECERFFRMNHGFRGFCLCVARQQHECSGRFETVRNFEPLSGFFKVYRNDFSGFGIECFHACGIEIKFCFERFEALNVDVVVKTRGFAVEIAEIAAGNMDFLRLTDGIGDAVKGGSLERDSDRIGELCGFADHRFGGVEPMDFLEKRKVVREFAAEVEMRVEIVLHTEDFSALADEFREEFRLFGGEVHHFRQEDE